MNNISVTKSKASVFVLAALFVACLVATAPHVASAALEWGTSSQTVSDKSTNITSPSVVVSADGKRAIAVWRFYDGTNSVIQASTATVSGTTTKWAAPTTLGTAGTLAQAPLGGAPVVRISADGSRGVVLWMFMDPSTGGRGKANIVAFGSGSPVWSSAIDVTPATNDHRMLTGALSGDGNTLIMTWYRDGVGANWSWAARSAAVSDTGLTLGTMYDVPSTLGAMGQRAVISNDGTKALLVATRSSTINSLAASISNGVATWGSVQTVITPAGSDGYYNPDIRGNLDGSTVIVVGNKSSGANKSMVAFVGTRSSNSMTWSAPADLATGLAGTPTAIALNASSNLETIVASWMVSSYPNNTISVATGSVSGSTATWQTASAIESSATSTDQGTFAVSSDGTTAAGFWVATLPGSSGSTSLRGSLSTASVASGVATWSTPTRTDTAALTPQSTAIALSADGKAAAAVYVVPSDTKYELRSTAFGVATPTTTTSTTTATTTPTSSGSPTTVTATTGASAGGSVKTQVTSRQLVESDSKVYTTAPQSVPVNAAVHVLTSSQAKTMDLVSQTPSTCLGAVTDLVFLQSGTCTAQVVSVSTRQVIRTLRTRVVPSSVSTMKVGNAIVTLAPLYFFNGTTTLRPGSTTRLAAAAKIAKTAGRVLIVGHTGNLSGNTPENQALSKARADLVTTRLTQLGVRNTKAIGVGALAPISRSTSENGQNKNRRVVVVLVP